jgi:C1A family cysteine protease
MTRSVLFGLLLALVPAAASAQGAMVETLDEVRQRPEPPEYRGLLPASVDLTSNIPAPRDQGDTSSCTSWGATYAAASHAVRRAGAAPAVTLSPAFIYNQVSGDRFCRTGTRISSTLDFLRDVGALPLEEFAFDAGWCGRKPTEAERQRAARYRIKGWSRFDARNLEVVKAQLARGVPVIFSMRVGLKMRSHRGDGVLDNDYGGMFEHTMLAVGYDDARKAVRIQNSWGRGWADGGHGWFSYEFWKRNVQVGFVID